MSTPIGPVTQNLPIPIPVLKGGTGSKAFTAGSIIYSNGTILTQDNSAFSWDDVHKVLQIADGSLSLNVAVGLSAFQNNTTGSQNAVLGAKALQNNTTGNNNMAIGAYALNINSSGSSNTAVGQGALQNNKTGSSNVALGNAAGKLISGSLANNAPADCVYIGALTESLAAGDIDEIVIGYNAVGAGSHTITLGASTVTKTILQGVIASFNGLATAGFGLSPILGVDNRTSLTTTDAAAITLYTTTGSGQLYQISARLLMTAGTTPSATYTVAWTEAGVLQTATENATALNTERSSTVIIQPDNATPITVQLTALSSGGTVNVAGTVKRIV